MLFSTVATLIFIPTNSVGGELDFFSSFFFLGPHLQPVEVPRLGAKLELQLLAYITATATLNS